MSSKQKLSKEKQNDRDRKPIYGNCCVCFGHMLKLKRENQKAEKSRRITLSWSAFGRLGYVFKNSSFAKKNAKRLKMS